MNTTSHPANFRATTPAPAGTAADARIEALLLRAVALLSPHSESPRLDAELLMAHVLRTSRTALLVRATDEIAADARQAFERLIERRITEVPIAYLTGVREFWSLELNVTPDVLVPRPDTEVLVELTLPLLPQTEPCRVLDLGTGSGAIALAIASERPHAAVTGVDIAERALAVARSNSIKLHLEQVVWRLGSWFDAVPGERFDVIVANPPYIAAGDPALRHLAAEPATALTSGPTGLESLIRIAADAPDHLLPRGWLLLEHGSGQAPAVAALLARHGFSSVTSHADYAGHPRVTRGVLC